METNQTTIIKDFTAKTILISREFHAPLPAVWNAYTQSEILEKWWAPAPWRAESQFMDFSVGGHWLYAMVSPEGQKHYGRMNYTAIELHKWYEMEDVFCDENGVANTALPLSKGTVSFQETAAGTRVEFNMIYPTESDLKAIVEMGFEQGISACIEQLAVLLSLPE